MENKILDSELINVTGGTGDSGVTGAHSIGDIVLIAMNACTGPDSQVYSLILQCRITSAPYESFHGEVCYDALVLNQSIFPEGIANLVGTTMAVSDLSIELGQIRAQELGVRF